MSNGSTPPGGWWLMNGRDIPSKFVPPSILAAAAWCRDQTRDIGYIHSIFVPPSQSNDIAKKSAFKPKRGHESTTGIHLIDE